MTHIYTNKKKHKMKQKKNYTHIMTESVKNKYVTHNKNDKALSNLFFYFSSVKDMKNVSNIFPVS